jgi:hypothetical protein
VAEDEGPPAADEIDVLAAVGILHPGAPAGGEEGGIAAHGAVGADGGVDAAGDDFSGAGKEGSAAGMGASFHVQIV